MKNHACSRSVGTPRTFELLPMFAADVASWRCVTASIKKSAHDCKFCSFTSFEALAAR